MRVGLPGSVSGGSGANRALGHRTTKQGRPGRQGRNETGLEQAFTSRQMGTARGREKQWGIAGFRATMSFCASDDPDQHRTTRLPNQSLAFCTVMHEWNINP